MAAPHLPTSLREDKKRIIDTLGTVYQDICCGTGRSLICYMPCAVSQVMSILKTGGILHENLPTFLFLIQILMNRSYLSIFSFICLMHLPKYLYFKWEINTLSVSVFVCLPLSLSLHLSLYIYGDLRQHPTRHQLYGHLPPITKTIQVRRTRHAEHCWRSKDKLISDLLLWTPTYGRAKTGRPARTYIQQLC